MTIDRKTIRFLFGSIFLDQTTITITFPLITLIFFDAQSRLFAADVSLATRSFWYGVCVSLPNFINLFFAPILSALSDEFGRKKILLIEIASAIVFTLFVGLGVYFGKLAFVFLGFMIRGAFCRTNPTALTIIGDCVTQEKKILYMSYLQFAISIGAAIGPVLGGFFAMRYFFPTLNFAFPFFVAAAIAILNTFFTFKFMRETLKKSVAIRFSEFNLPTIKNVFLQKDVLTISLILLLTQISWSTYYQFMPPILKSVYHFNPHQLGFFMGMIAFWLALSTSLGMNVLHRLLNSYQLLLLASYLLLLGLVLTLLGFIWVGMIPTAAGDVLAYSCLTALYSNAVESKKQGKVMGISFIVVGLVWGATGFLGGILMGLSPHLPLLLAPLGIISAIIFMHVFFYKTWYLNTSTI